MKKAVLLFMIFAVTISCKEDKKNDTEATQEDKTIVAEPGKTLKQSDGLIALQGNFIYSEKDKAAVLQTSTQMYGIVIDKKMHELDRQVQQYKTEDTDMVPVTIRGRMFKKDPNVEGWEDIIEIKEILQVSEPNPNENEVIKLGSK
ncbi:MAG: hypothetical protein V7719_09800 [Psychroserpens sp.]|uniref:hypothetical protein n=1 Tax=Psychroserpens sp. TaxID=2020870 RepID=UPI00300118EC